MRQLALLGIITVNNAILNLSSAEAVTSVIASEAKQSPEMKRLTQKTVQRDAGSLCSSQ
jgi:hypothetical protein